MNPEQDIRGGWTSASNAAADELCFGRHQAQAGMPEQPSDDSDFGRAVHHALATDDTTGLDEEQLTRYEQCVEIRTKLINQFFGNDAPNVKLIKERRLWCHILAVPGDKSAKPARYSHSGQADLIARLGKRALIIEYKALKGDIASSPSNKQLRDQVVLAAGELMLTEVGSSVVQPLVTFNPDICLYTQESIKRAEAEMYARVRANNAKDAKRTANIVSCKFCLAKGECGEYQAWMSSIVPKADVLGATPVVQWSPEMRTHFLNIRPVIQDWLDKSYDELKEIVKQQADAVPGYRLKPNSDTTVVSDPAELFRRFVDAGREWATKHNTEMHADYVLQPVFMKCVKVINKEFTSAVRQVTGLKGKALEAKVDALREGITTSNPKDASLVKIK